jgi:hypothetical protein
MEAALVLGTVKLGVRVVNELYQMKKRYDFLESEEFKHELSQLFYAANVFDEAEKQLQTYLESHNSEIKADVQANLKYLLETNSRNTQEIIARLKNEIKEGRQPNWKDALTRNLVNSMKEVRDGLFRAMETIQTFITTAQFAVESKTNAFNPIKDAEARMFWMDQIGKEGSVLLDTFASQYLKFLNFFHQPDKFKVKLDIVKRIIANLVGK